MINNVYTDQMSSLAAKLKKNTKVKITTKGEYNGLFGLVKYVGPIEEKKADGDYVGLELQKPVGKNNGTHNGKEYFKTKPNHGLFLKPTSLSLMDGTPVVPPALKANVSNKLSKDLEEAEKVVEKVEEPPRKEEEVPEKYVEVHPVKQESVKQEAKASEPTDRGEIEQLKKKLKALDEEVRTLRIQNEKVKFSTKDKDEGKENELKQQIEFYKGQKEAVEKEKADLKKKNAQLNAQLEEYAENIGMVDTLTIKIENLESKNEKLKQDLETANSELKNFRMMGDTSGKNEAELNENLKILNETVTLLESDLKEMSDKNEELEAELKKRETIDADYKKLERKLKQKEEEVEQMANELELMSDTANFVEKLTINMLKKDEQLKQATEKFTEYLSKYEQLENELALNKQFSDELNQELFHQEQLMDKYSQEIEEKNKHIAEMNRQVEKYKKKLFDLTQANESSSMNTSAVMDDKEDLNMSKMFFVDQYQSKYYSLLKVNNEIRKNELNHLLQFSEIRNHVGVYILNLIEALPESFTQKLEPSVVSLLTATKSANDKLFYIFMAISDIFKDKADIYSKENSELVQWLIILLKEVVPLYGCLQRIQFAFTTADTDEQISEILEQRSLKDELRRVNDFAFETLHRFVDQNISASIDLEPFVNSIQKFDEINIGIKRSFSTEHSTKMKLCSDAMETVSNILEAIQKYKSTNPLGENAEVDNLLFIFLKTILSYVRECCMNPYIRFKSEMKEYLKGLNLINSILAEIAVEGNYHELNSLYSETENIRMLRETILTTQFHVNSLENDLQDIVYKSEVDKIQTQLVGKFWQDRIKLIKEELLKVKQVSEEKAEVEHQLNEAKKKILILERDLKDKQSAKELYEKRIGELQLKVEQVISIENENKRQGEKLKSYEDANQVIEQEILNLQKKYKLVEEENRKIKEKYDTLQTETMMRNKMQRSAASMSSEDVASLTIFKNAIKESNHVRNLDIKKKMMCLKQSPIYLSKKSQKEDESQVTVARAKAFDQICKFSITDPFSTKSNPNPPTMDSILKQIEKLKGNNIQQSNQCKSMRVGTMLISLGQAKQADLSSTGISLAVN